MNQRARTRSAREVHGQQEIPGQEITQGCTQVHALEVHAPDPLFRGGGHLDIDWDARLRTAVEKTVAARQARRDERAAFKARRDAGLVQRYAAKTARINRGEPVPDQLPPCCADLEDPPCPQHAQAATRDPEVRS